ncbi:MAG: Vitamin B12 dependent methionine synthase activation subunit [Clostridia bacterium]|nr:Vitamin B12 dependent methionine synthase activation subunit [Clostridia bacterium]
MENTIYTRSYGAPPWNRREILRYAGVKGDTSELDALLQSCLDEVEDKLVYRVCYREFAVTQHPAYFDLGFLKSASAGLKKNLSGCESIILFAATIGIEIDRLIARSATVSATKALLFQAIGAERIESLCDAFNCNITEQKAAEGLRTRPRFSAGYGDFPLEAQKDIFAVLDCSRRIGLTLNESLLMSPSKSVTAIIGVGR